MGSLNLSLLKKIYYPVALIFIIIMLISILSFNPMDSNKVNSQINALGGLGYAIASYFYLWFGYAFYFFILFFISFYISTFPKKYRIIKKPQIIGQLILLFAFTMLLSSFNPGSGGLIGGALRGVVEFALGKVGVYIIIVLMVITSIASIINFDLFSVNTYKILYNQFKQLFERIAQKNNGEGSTQDATNSETSTQTNTDNNNEPSLSVDDASNTRQTSNSGSQTVKNYDTDSGLFAGNSLFEMESLANDYLRKQSKTNVFVENPILSESIKELKKKQFQEDVLSVGVQQKNFDPYSGLHKMEEQNKETSHTQTQSKNTTKQAKEKKYDLNFLESLNLRIQEQEAETKDFNFIEKILKNISEDNNSTTSILTKENAQSDKSAKEEKKKQVKKDTTKTTNNDDEPNEDNGLFEDLEETINYKIKETERQKNLSKTTKQDNTQNSKFNDQPQQKNDIAPETIIDKDDNGKIKDEGKSEEKETFVEKEEVGNYDNEATLDDDYDEDETEAEESSNEDLDLENCEDIKSEMSENQPDRLIERTHKTETQSGADDLRGDDAENKDILSNILFEDAFEDDDESYSNHPDLNEHFTHLRVSRFKKEDHTSETNLLIKKLEATLREFKIEAKVTGVSRGPVITRFEIQPAPGIKLSKIVGLADNISLALRGVKIRIIAPIPGKSAVGIEVPNNTRDMVRLGDVFISDAFKYSEAHLPVVIGKEISGKIRVADLVHMPHLLVAGSTNSGKSVCINSIICSLLYSKTPEEVKFILVDPKIVELKIYNDLPNLLTPVITEPKKASLALKWLVKEMLRRYKLLESYSSRNILNYNRKVRKLEKLNLATDEPLNYIVLIIDEFADLMLVAKKEVEESVNRLAAMARAVGIHLILATQRPSTDVITGVIKSNFPARIGFRVSSIHDSRTILDKIGAEKLLGKGDMLFFTPGLGNPIRIQGTFITEDEIIRVTDNLRKLGKPNYIEDIFEDEEDSENGDDDDNFDEPLWKEAIDIVVKEQKASASYLQRKLKIGYNRAARIIEQMEREGIVGPEQGSKPREVLI